MRDIANRPIFVKKPDDKPATLEERLIGAFISAIAMACTIVALSFVIFVIASKGRYVGVQFFFQFVFSRISLFIIAAAAVLGFFLDFNKMVNIFSFLWGTNPEYDINSMSKFTIIVAVCIAAGIAVFLIRH